MNDEMLRNEGRLAQAELDLKRLAIRITGLIQSIRDCLDPFADIPDLRTDEAATQCVELADIRIRWNEMAHRIQALKKALGKP
jgi:hypothetical protein